MSVDSSLTYGRHQPFYTVLLSDGSRRYVAEENIQVLYREKRHRVDVVTKESREQSSSLSSSQPSSATLSTLAQSVDVETQANVEGGPMDLDETEAVTETGTEAAPAPAPAPSAAATTTLPTTPTPPVSSFSELGPLGIKAVGQYFESWNGQEGHYVMNRELIRVYPTEDYL